MTKLEPTMRLKVKRDTFFLPEPNNGVYFRNNVSSFRMEGSMVDQWVEKLIPMFNGEHTLDSLTNGLPEPYRDRVYQIAETLYQNEFVKDVSRDRPHQLTEQVRAKYASQIEFIDSFTDSAAFRFQEYRQAKVVAVGAGDMLLSLVSALIQSGLPRFQIVITDVDRTNRQRLQDLVTHARTTDPEVDIEEITLSSWQECVKPVDTVLYVSQQGNVEEVAMLQRLCREEKKAFIPALCYQGIGMAGPLFLPDSEHCWESAWRRLHQDQFNKNKGITESSTTAGAMLANLIVFELFKNVTGVTEREQNHPCFILDLQTMEGNWHTFFPHPLVVGHPSAKLAKDVEARIGRDSKRGEKGPILLFFNKLTSQTTGIFHTWDEGDLLQLPLAQCSVQPVDPLSEGPSQVLEKIIVSGLSHEEARREAGLAGIEAYGKRLTSLHDLPSQLVIGAGETFSEAVCRGLQKYLVQEYHEKSSNGSLSLSRVQLSKVEDERCKYYLQSLKTMHGDPVIGLGEVSGFPAVWIGTRDGWVGSVGLTTTLALRNALQQAIYKLQNHEAPSTTQGFAASSVRLDEKALKQIPIPDGEALNHSVLLKSAKGILEVNGRKLIIYELESEPIFKEGLAGLFGVMVEEEGRR